MAENTNTTNKKYLGEEGLSKLVEHIKTCDDTTLTVADEHIAAEVGKIKSGTVTVKEAEHAGTATTATTCTGNAATATEATKAKQDGVGNVIADTYELKSDAAAKLNAAKSYADAAAASAASGKADKATSLAGYGITDAYTKSDIDGKVSDINTDISGKENTGVAASLVSSHNTSTSAHNDIRDLISALTKKITDFINVSDADFDTLGELIEYIEANRESIESFTTGKVNVSDIVNNLTTNVTNKPLSAAQGVAIKALIDALQEEVDSKADAHSHPYAGSATQGGSANSAVKLDSSAGSATQPVYFSDGKPVKTTHTLGASVPADAKFTDTTYGVVSTTAAGLAPQRDGSTTKFLRGDGSWAVPSYYEHPTTAGNKHIPVGGASGQVLKWSADGTAKWDTDKDTTYSAGSGLSMSGTTINHATTVTAGTAKGSSGSVAHGGSISIPSITYNATGHITSATTTSVTLPTVAAITNDEIDSICGASIAAASEVTF